MPAVLRRPAAAPSEPPGVTDRFARVVRSRPFEIAIVVVIMANGVVLGLETYAHLGGFRPALRWLEWSFRVIFVAEIAARVLAYGRRPQDFFRQGWNVFDFVVVAAIFLPGLHGDSALLRVLRVARVLRLVRFSPGLRTIVAALLRSLPGVGGFLALAVVTLYVYGMAGWLIFGGTYPEQYGDIGRALLTLFVLLSLETLPDLIEQGLAVSPWTLLYYVSFVVITVNLLLNILIAVIVNSMEEARRLEMTERLAPGYDEDGDGVPDEVDRIALTQRLDDLRAVIAELERELRIDRDDLAGRAHRDGERRAGR
ncbi:ion transporter [Micromonospora olivasterospora]|uniref:Voltage-gated sodium channel n=1 Tax=Micromonospora olivasterospora TaxID=1880 RepID=A0A562IFB2_MICOL|nr:ion transporter [Micromonospora olivasterospora]TWH69711.1 voltage-gated sodium channel [Micromonospora olivasterospora]